MLDGIEGTVFTTGDNVYEDGTAAEWRDCYGPSWGRHKDRTRPAPGNHDYNMGGSAYYDYFGANAGPSGRGYYSYDIGTWHVISLNSNVAADPDSDQYEWLRADLAANPTECAVAYWHHPLFSSGSLANDSMAQVWKLLDESGVDVAMVGHDHFYERFAPQDYTGKADPNGMREFIVGTGGRNLFAFDGSAPNSEVRNNDTLGLLMLTLHPDSYDFEFVSEPGRTSRDSGTVKCDATVDTRPPVVSEATPGKDATKVDITTNVAAVFSEEMDAATLANNFALVADGVAEPVEAAVTYDAATKTLTLDPEAALAPGATYTATIEGGVAGAKDLAGNALASDEVWTFTTAATGCTITGSPGSETLTGTSVDDVICGLGGDDIIRGAGGDDTIRGGEGSDTLTGEAGSDKLYGEAGNDALNAKDGVRKNDLADGGEGRDTCTRDKKDKLASCP